VIAPLVVPCCSLIALHISGVDVASKTYPGSVSGHDAWEDRFLGELHQADGGQPRCASIARLRQHPHAVHDTSGSCESLSRDLVLAMFSISSNRKP
jgi:hypothetical protein